MEERQGCSDGLSFVDGEGSSAANENQIEERWSVPLLHAGATALAVLATLCPVPDYFAHAFAAKFYEFLHERLQDTTGVHRRYRYLAETLLGTRRYFMEEFNNPLGLAYTLYAMRGAHIEADFAMKAGGAP
jgi:hypothetical protein